MICWPFLALDRPSVGNMDVCSIFWKIERSKNRFSDVIDHDDGDNAASEVMSVAIMINDTQCKFDYVYVNMFIYIGT